jgi:hypothetical protein
MFWRRPGNSGRSVAESGVRGPGPVILVRIALPSSFPLYLRSRQSKCCEIKYMLRRERRCFQVDCIALKNSMLLLIVIRLYVVLFMLLSKLSPC